MKPALVAVAHGSRDPRSAATISALVDRVRLSRPDLDVRLAFLDLCAPRLDAVLATVSRAVVVPLLLGRAFHADVDVPSAVARAVAARPSLDVTVADVLGPDPRLEAVALRRLAEAGVSPADPGFGVVLAAAGSQQAPANAAVTAVAAAWMRRTRWRVVPAFACAAQPTVPDAIATLQASGARRIAVASWFLAPGLLPDKVTRLARESTSDAVFATPLGAHDAVAALIVDQDREELRGRMRPEPLPSDVVLVVRGGPDTVPKLQAHARRTARAWCLDGGLLFGISVFCALDDIGPASLPGLLNSRLRTYWCIHYCPVSALRLIGVHLLPTGHRPHFTAVIASDEEGELRRLLACLGPPRKNPYRMLPPRGRKGGNRDRR